MGDHGRTAPWVLAAAIAIDMLPGRVQAQAGNWSGLIECTTTGRIEVSGAGQGTRFELKGKDAWLTVQVTGSNASIAVLLVGTVAAKGTIPGKLTGNKLTAVGSIVRSRSMVNEQCTIDLTRAA